MPSIPVLGKRAAIGRQIAIGLILPIVLLVPTTAKALDVSVNCDADPATLPPGTYPTIAAALSVLMPLDGPHSIMITGTCVENVQIQSRDRLELRGPEGGTATIVNAADPPFWTIAIGRSRQIALRRLVVRGGSVGIRIDSASSVDILETTVEDNPGQAVFVDENSTVRMNQITIRNSGSGLNVNNSSHVSLSLGSESPAFVTIQNNTGAGVFVSNATVLGFGGTTTVENNGGAGINATNSTVNFNGPLTIQGSGGTGFAASLHSTIGMGGDTGTTPVRISGNGGSGIALNSQSVANIRGDTIVENHPSGVGINVNGSQLILNARAFPNIIRGANLGINVQDGSTASINGNYLVQNNTRLGVQVGTESAARFNQLGLTGGGVVAGVIEGNPSMGLNIGSAQVFFLGPHKIRNNGAAPSPSEAGLNAGIRLTVGAVLSLRRDVEITGNFGPGVLADFDASINVGFSTEPPSNVMITGNSAEGIRLLRNSRAWFANAGSVSGNGMDNLTCDASSWLFGDLTGVSTYKCSNTDAEKVPKK